MSVSKLSLSGDCDSWDDEKVVAALSTGKAGREMSTILAMAEI